MLDETFDQGFENDIGVEIVSAEKDLVTARVEARRRHLNRDGVVHGGMIMAFADTAAARGALLNIPDGAGTTTIESKTNFVRAAGPGLLSCDSKPLHIGRSTMLWQSIVSDVDNRTLAIITQTQMILTAARSDPTAHAQLTAPSTNAPGEVKGGERAPTTGPRSTAEKRKAQIVKAAVRVISKKGFANAAIREIAQEAGMPVPTMYQYVKSKGDILAIMFNSYLTVVEESVQYSTVGAASAAEKLRMAIAANVKEFDRFQTHIRVMNRETASLRPELRRRVKNHMLSYIDIFRNIIDEGIRAGDFRPIDARLFANFTAMLCEVWPLRNWSVGEHGLEGVQAGIVDLVLHSLAQPKRAAT